MVLNTKMKVMMNGISKRKEWRIVTKIITPDNLIDLRNQLDLVDDYNDLLNDEHIIINDTDIADIDIPEQIVTDDVTLSYANSGVAETIEFQPSGQIFLENDLTKFDNLYVDDLTILHDVGTHFTNWWNQLPEYNI